VHHRRPGARLPLTFPLTPTLTTDPYQVHEFINNSGLVRGKAPDPGQSRRPGSGRAGCLRLEAPSRLRTAALWAPEQ